MKGVAIALASLLPCLLAHRLAAQPPPTWTLQTTPASPGVLYRHAMAFDAARQRVVLFGGAGSGFVASDETWEWDGTSWLHMTPPVRPAGRYSHALAYDAARQQVLMFGGTNAAGTFLSETWAWNGSVWTQLSPAGSPPARAQHSMTYDSARQRVVLFGGFGGTPTPNLMGDTWEWDGASWVPRFSANFPSPRADAGLAYDPVRQKTVLFAGRNASAAGFATDLWEWDGLNWAFVSPPGASPMGRHGHALAYHEQKQRILLFGGSSGPIVPLQNDTWEWDGVSWTQISMVQSPTGRYLHAAAYDGTQQRVILYGGFSLFQFLSDTWTTGVFGTMASATPYGSGCGFLSPLLTPDPSRRPVSGMTGGASIVNAPTNVGALMIGFSNQFFGPFQLPVTLAGVGMPGCDLLQSNEIFGFPVAAQSATSMDCPVFIPSTPSLVGAHVYLQGYVLAPNENPLQVVVTNGLDWFVGDV